MRLWVTSSFRSGRTAELPSSGGRVVIRRTAAAAGVEAQAAQPVNGRIPERSRCFRERRMAPSTVSLRTRFKQR